MAMQRQSFMAKFLKIMGYMALGAVFYAFFMLMLFNLITMCGEVIYYPDGTWETGECSPSWMFPNYEPAKGVWK